MVDITANVERLKLKLITNELELCNWLSVILSSRLLLEVTSIYYV